MNSLECGLGISKEFGLNSDVSSRALDLSSEVGESCKEVFKSTNYGSTTFQSTENLELELGEVMVSLVLLGSSS